MLLKTSMKLRWLIFIGFAVAVFSIQLSAQEKVADEVIKVSTSLVSVPVIVTDRQGRYIPDIKREEFAILQDGVEQKIDFFADAEEPINIALLIDTSNSTRLVLDDIKSAAKKMVKLLNADDKAMIVSFDYTTHVLSPLTSDKKALEKAIKKSEIPDEIGTTLRDAVDETVRKQFADVTGRKAIIVLTDGKDHGSTITSTQLLHSLQETDVIIYTVYFNTQFRRRPRPDFGDRGVFGGGRRGGVFGGRIPDNESYPRFPRDERRGDMRNQRTDRESENAKEFLRRLSDTTAGRYYESDKSKFKEVFALIVDELRHQYRLGYYPPDESSVGKTHSIRVKVMRPDLAVRARLSYRAAAK